MIYPRISGTGLYAPEKVITNQYFNEKFQVDVDEHIRPVLGIIERRWAEEEESAASMGTAAGKQALDAAGIPAAQVNLLIVATDTPEYISPSTSHVVQHMIGAKQAIVWDMSAACASFVVALDTAVRFMQTDPAIKNALVIGTYNMSKFLDHDDVQTSSIFADGAGAIVLTADNKPGYLAATHIADGSYHDYIGIYAGGSRFPINEERLKNKDHLLKFAKRFPADTNSSRWPGLVQQTVAKADLKVEDIGLALFTQINLSVIKEVMATLGLPMDKTHTIMDRYGYTGSACIPMALADSIFHGKLKPDDLVVLTASGGGYSMATVALRY